MKSMFILFLILSCSSINEQKKPDSTVIISPKTSSNPSPKSFPKSYSESSKSLPTLPIVNISRTNPSVNPGPKLKEKATFFNITMSARLLIG